MPPNNVGFNIGLACTVGGYALSNAGIRCAGTDQATPTPPGYTPTPCPGAPTPCRAYVFALSPTGVLRWTSCLGGGTTNCYLSAEAYVGAALLDHNGASYVSDDSFLTSFNALGTPNPGWVPTPLPLPSPTPQVGQVNNPAAAVVSWNMTDSGYLVGQAYAGYMLALNPNNGQVTGQVDLRDTLILNGTATPGRFISTNTASVAGNRVYSVTQFCPDSMTPSACATPLNYNDGRLYAFDVDPATGILAVAWYWDFDNYAGSSGAVGSGPSGASPMVFPTGTAPPGNLIYTDGALLMATATPGAGGSTPTPVVDPLLFAVKDNCATLSVFPTVTPTTIAGATATNTPQPATSTPTGCMGSGNPSAPTNPWTDDLYAQFGQPRLCGEPPLLTYKGIQTAFALDPRSTPGAGWIWGSARCADDLLQLSAQTGQMTDDINIGNPGTGGTPTPIAPADMQGYGPASALLTAPNGPYGDGDPVMFLGVDHNPLPAHGTTYVLAIDLKHHALLWRAPGVGPTSDSALDEAEAAQYPIAVTATGKMVLVAPQYDGTIQGLQWP